MHMPTSRALRRIAVAALLPLAAFAASCAPEPPATPTCPALQAGTWSGSWGSDTYPDRSGGVLAQLIATTTSVGGTFSLTGSVLGEPAVITGTISCDKITGITSDGLTLTGTIAPGGDSIEGTYFVRALSDSGTFDIEQVVEVVS